MTTSIGGPRLLALCLRHSGAEEPTWRRRGPWRRPNQRALLDAGRRVVCLDESPGWPAHRQAAARRCTLPHAAARCLLQGAAGYCKWAAPACCLQCAAFGMYAKRRHPTPPATSLFRTCLRLRVCVCVCPLVCSSSWMLADFQRNGSTFPAGHWSRLHCQAGTICSELKVPTTRCRMQNAECRVRIAAAPIGMRQTADQLSRRNSTRHEPSYFRFLSFSLFFFLPS